MATAHEILEFWFGAEGARDYGQFRNVWFVAEPGFDNEIRERFLETHQQAAAGGLDHWQAQPRGTLALVIVLDQFSRNLFRGSFRMYENDGKALTVAETAIDKGFDLQLPAFQRLFLYMPFMHSEDLNTQQRGLSLFRLIEPDPKYAIEHKEIIERFGRFPHRNAILGRQSTPEEEKFLDEQKPEKGR